MSMNCGVSKIGGIIRMFLPMPMSTFVQCGFVTLPQNPQQFAVQSVSFHRRARCVLNWTEIDSGDEFFRESSGDCEVRAVSAAVDPAGPCEVILDSGADITVLPAHLFGSVGTPEQQTTQLLDAQGAPIPQMSQRANVSFVVEGVDGRQIVFRDRAVLAKVRQPLLCAGKLFSWRLVPKV